MSDYFNSFANPQGGGGQDIPQPGTPAWAQWLAMISGQGPMAGQQPGQAIASAAMPATGAPSSPSGPLAAGGLSPQLQAAINDPSLMNAQAYYNPARNLVTKGHSVNASDAPPPPETPAPPSQQGKQQGKQSQPKAPPPPPAHQPTPAPGYLNSTSATPPGSPGATAGPLVPEDTPNLGGGVTTTARDPNTSVTPPTGPLYPAADVSLYPHALIPGAPSSGATPNLGYYRPTMGNAQGNPTWVPQGAQGAPQMFRGPLALPGSQNYYAQPAAGPAQAAAPAPAPPPPAAAGAGPGPIAPGVGTQWLRKIFPGLQPTT